MFYKHLTPNKRIIIQEFLSQGLKNCEILEKINRHYSTLYQELKHNFIRKDNAIYKMLLMLKKNILKIKKIIVKNKIKESNLHYKGKSLKRKTNFQITEMNKRSI